MSGLRKEAAKGTASFRSAGGTARPAGANGTLCFAPDFGGKASGEPAAPGGA